MRLFKTIALAAFLMGSVSAVGTACRVDAPVATYEVYTYRVQPGDTLWGIAGGFALPGSDLREVVYAIRHLNELDSAVIHPGQLLMVPVEE